MISGKAQRHKVGSTGPSRTGKGLRSMCVGRSAYSPAVDGARQVMHLRPRHKEVSRDSGGAPGQDRRVRFQEQQGEQEAPDR